MVFVVFPSSPLRNRTEIHCGPHVLQAGKMIILDALAFDAKTLRFQKAMRGEGTKYS